MVDNQMYVLLFGEYTAECCIACVPCCDPELGILLAVEGVLSLGGVLCFPVASAYVAGGDIMHNLDCQSWFMYVLVILNVYICTILNIE